MVTKIKSLVTIRVSSSSTNTLIVGLALLAVKRRPKTVEPLGMDREKIRSYQELSLAHIALPLTFSLPPFCKIHKNERQKSIAQSYTLSILVLENAHL